jgi:hypothetical protein
MLKESVSQPAGGGPAGGGRRRTVPVAVEAAGAGGPSGLARGGDRRVVPRSLAPACTYT